MLFISHCIGTIAALNTIEKVAETRQVGLVSIAPPLPSPRNTVATPQSVRAWHDEWSGALSPAEAKILQDRAPIIYDAAHGLYVSPLVGREVSNEENVLFQTQNIRKLIDTGLELLEP